MQDFFIATVTRDEWTAPVERRFLVDVVTDNYAPFVMISHPLYGEVAIPYNDWFRFQYCDYFVLTHHMGDKSFYMADYYFGGDYYDYQD